MPQREWRYSSPRVTSQAWTNVTAASAPDPPELAKPAKARRTDAGNVLVETQVRRQRHAKYTDLVTRRDRFSPKLQGWTSAPQQSRTMA